MEKNKLMKTVMLVLALFVTTAALQSCDDDDDKNYPINSVEELYGSYNGSMKYEVGNNDRDIPVTGNVTVKAEKDGNGVKLTFSQVTIENATVEGITLTVTPQAVNGEYKYKGTAQIALPIAGQQQTLSAMVTDCEFEKNKNGNIKFELDAYMSNVPGISNIEIDYEGWK